MISGWRKQIGMANQAALAPKRRGPKPDALARQIQQLERDNARLRHKLERAELIIDAQKKLCVALGLPTADDGAGMRDARRGPARSTRRPEECLSGFRAKPRVRVPRSCPAWRDRVTPRAAGSATAPLGALERRAGSIAGTSRQRALCGRWRRPRSSPRCSMKAAITARSVPCIGSWQPSIKLASAAVSEFIRSTPSPSSWRSGRTKCGPGISPN